MSGKLLFRIEHYFDNAWTPVKVHIGGPRYGIAPVEWHETKDVAVEYAKREVDNAKIRAPFRANEFRVTDHIGNVHWKDPQ